MRRVVLAALVACSAAASIAACSSFSSDSEAPSPDASAPADAALAPDATPLVDGAAADAGGCASATGYVVCADFPDPDAALPTGGFGGLAGSPSTALAIEPDPGDPANYVLHVRADTFDGGRGQVYLYKDLATAPQTLTFSARMRTDGKGVANYVEYFAILTQNPTDLEVVVAESGGELQVDDVTADASAVKDLAVAPFDVSWVRVEVQLWFDATSTSVEIRKDGVVTLSKRPLLAAGGRALAGRALRFAAGVFYASPPTTVSGAYLDDIRLSVTP